MLSQFGSSPGIHIDSAAGQGLHCLESAFHGTLTPCRYRIDGIGGSDYVTAYGSVFTLLAAFDSLLPTHVGVFYNQLFAPNAQGTAIASVSQIQTQTSNSCHLDSNSSPYLIADSVKFKLHLSGGLFMLPCWHLAFTDPRLSSLPRVDMTMPGPFTPVSTARWKLTPLIDTLSHTSTISLKAFNFHVHTVDPTSFRDALALTRTLGTDISPSPPQNHTYSTKILPTSQPWLVV